MGRLPEIDDKVSIAAGSGKNGIVYCSIEEVRVVTTAREVVNSSNWKLFVPWVHSLSEALGVYAELDNGSGMVFVKLSCIDSSRNIGCPGKPGKPKEVAVVAAVAVAAAAAAGDSVD